MSTPSVYLMSGGVPRFLEAPLPWPRIRYDPGLRVGCDALTYEAIYRTQPNVRTVVSFLATNVAQVGVHTYQRRGETDRVRLRDHPLAVALTDPWPGVTQYQLIEALVSDLAIYAEAFWLKVARPNDQLGLFRVPPPALAKIEYDDAGLPRSFTFTRGNGKPPLVVGADRVAYFPSYSPIGPGAAESTLESLRLLLAEDMEAARYREQLWRNGARVGGVLKRPMEAPDWSPETRQRFKAEWRSWYTGDNGSDAGGTPILEDGMEFVSGGFTSEQAQYLDARKLTMVQVAAAYHVPPPMVGVLDNANFSNVREFHRSLYQDTLGPWFRRIEQQVNASVLPDTAPTEGVYVEFNVSEKLRGSFEEQSVALYRAVGAPYMTRSEARARMNLPERADADGLIVPLNTAATSPGDQLPSPDAVAEPEVEPGAASRANGHRVAAG